MGGKYKDIAQIRVNSKKYFCTNIVFTLKHNQLRKPAEDEGRRGEMAHGMFLNVIDFSRYF